MNLALRGFGAPFGIALSRRLAIDWLYAWTRNPMVLATLAFLAGPGTLVPIRVLRSVGAAPGKSRVALLREVFEERELEIRFGEPYRQYRATHADADTPPTEAAAVSPARSKPAAKPKSRKRTATKPAKQAED